MKQDRPLTSGERALLAHLLALDASTAMFLPQLDALRVVARCDCGCPSVVLALPGRAPATVSSPIVEAEARTSDGAAVGVLVFAADGALTELEVYSMGGEVPSLPDPAGIEWVAPPAV